MTAPNERVQIEVYAASLGWSVHRGEEMTAFGYGGRRIAVLWAEDGYAEHVQIHRADGTLLVTRNGRDCDTRGVVGDWVRNQLDAWLISYQRDTAERASAAGGES